MQRVGERGGEGGQSGCVMPRSLPRRCPNRASSASRSSGSTTRGRSPGAIRRRSGRASRNASTSSSVDDQPTLARSERSASTPIAASTGDGSSVSLEHDEPECTATPCWSSAEQDRLRLDALDAEAHEVGEARRRGRRSARRRRTAVAAAASRSVRRRAVAASRSSAPGRADARRHAAPKPTIAGTSSIPPRRARSCAPPTTNGGNAQPAPHEQRGGALRATELVAGDRAQVGAERREVDRDVPGRRAGVDVDDHVARRRAPRRSPRRPAAACRPRGWRAARDTSAVSGRDRGRHLRGVEASDAVDADDRRPASSPCRARRVEHRRSARPRWSRPRDRSRPSARAMRAAHRGVHRLGAAGGEHDLARARTEAAPRPARGRPRRATRVTRPSACSRPGSPWWSRRYGSIASNAPGAAATTTRGRGTRAARGSSDAGDAVVAAVGAAGLELR